MGQGGRMSITLRINSENQTFNEQINVSALLAALNIPLGTVVVERNREILHKDRFDDVLLKDGDELEIIRFVGGG